MKKITIEITETEKQILENDLVDTSEWVSQAVKGKINNCKKRMLKEWLPILMNDPKVQTIPADEGLIIKMITERSDYEAKKDRKD